MDRMEGAFPAIPVCVRTCTVHDWGFSIRARSQRAGGWPR